MPTVYCILILGVTVWICRTADRLLARIEVVHLECFELSLEA